jgi:UDP-N-acetylmuramyl pentapeptide synthase
MKLKDLLEGVPYVRFNGNEKQEIQGIAYYSKDVQPGFLFAALKGVKKDGFEFIDKALLNGAVAFLSEKVLSQFLFSSLPKNESCRHHGNKRKNHNHLLARGNTKKISFPSRSNRDNLLPRSQNKNLRRENHS